jgi:hypothetical protein
MLAEEAGKSKISCPTVYSCWFSGRKGRIWLAQKFKFFKGWPNLIHTKTGVCVFVCLFAWSLWPSLDHGAPYRTCQKALYEDKEEKVCTGVYLCCFTIFEPMEQKLLNLEWWVVSGNSFWKLKNGFLGTKKLWNQAHFKPECCWEVNILGGPMPQGPTNY